MLKLVQTDWGRFDLAVDDPAQADAYEQGQAQAEEILADVLNYLEN